MSGGDAVEHPDPAGLGRRRFLIGAAGVGGAVALGPTRLASAGSLPAPPAQLTRSVFAPTVGKYYWIQGTFKRLTLVEIGDLPGAPAGAEGQFSLLFSAPTAITGGVLSLTNLTLGTISLFVSPIDRGLANNFYEAVVNRLP
jgi:hypothetical protein